MSEIKTVRIVKANHAGYATINESDFNPEKHKLFGVEPPAPPEPTVKEIRARLSELKVEIPATVTKKDDLLELLKAAEAKLAESQA